MGETWLARARASLERAHHFKHGSAVADRPSDQVCSEAERVLQRASVQGLPEPQIIALLNGLCIEWRLHERHLGLYLDNDLSGASGAGGFWLAHWSITHCSLTWVHGPDWTVASQTGVRAFLEGANIEQVRRCLGPLHPITAGP
jgi:hypothetical protein